MKFQSQLQITTAAAVPPLTVNQTALVTNFNADLLDGQHGAYYATAASLGGYLPLTGGTLTGTLTGTVGIFTTVRTTELTSLLGSNGPITITPDGTGHVHINSTDIRIGPNNTNATLATRGTGDLTLRTNEGSAVEGYIKIFDGANGNIEITPNGTGTVVVGKLSGSTASFSGQITSTLASGTAPLVVTSNTVVANLNSDFLDGQHGAYYQDAGNLNAGTILAARMPAFTGGDVTSTVGTVGLNLTAVGTAGTYRSVTTDSKGRVTGGTNPTTLAGYGITDALPLSGGTLTGGLTGTSANFNGTFIQTGEALAVDACAIVHNSNVESYYQLSRRLQAFSHLGSTTTLEIEAVTLGNGGYGGEAQRTTWRISSRGALYVTRHDEHGGAGKVFLKILNDTAVPDANGQDAKYVVGLVCGNTTDYVMVWMRARFLQDSGTSRWVTIARLATAAPSTVSGSAMTYSSGWIANTGFTNTSFTEVVPAGKFSALALTGVLTSTVATGTAPLSITSTTLVNNLNSDFLDGQHGSYFEGRDTTAVGFSAGTLTLTRTTGNLTVSLDGRYLPLAGGTLTGGLSGTTGSFSGQITSTVATGTAPFSIASTTRVDNLNVQYLNGQLGTYYAAASSLTNYLPLSGGTLTGSLALHSNGGSSGFVTGTGDAATYALYNFKLSGWNGMAFENPTTGGAYPSQIVGVVDFRNGTIDMKGGFKVNGASVITENQSITISGDASGTGKTAINLTLASVGTAGTYRSVTTDAKGRVTAGTNPTTLAGYGITDALPITGGTLTGALTVPTQLSVIGTTATDILRLYVTGSTIWKLGVTDASGSLFNITADFGNFTINKSNGNVTTPGAFVGGNFSGPGTGLTGTAASLTAGAVAWTGVTGKPTTLSGYGITDALPLSGGAITGNTTFSGDNHLTFGPNSTWSSYIRIGGNGYTATGTLMASVVTTNGNLHLDSSKLAGRAVYLNWYGGTGGTFFGNGSSGQVGLVDGSGNASFSGTLSAVGAITQNGNQVLHAGNYTSYALSSVINQQGGKAYTVHDFNTYPLLYDVTFVNPTGSTNLPTGMSAVMSYRFIMGAGDTATRGFDLVGAAEGSGNLYIRERSLGTWSRVIHSNNYTSYPDATKLPLTGGTLTGALNSSAKIETSGNVIAGNFSGPGTGLTGTATSLTAGAVAWTGVTGKPTTLGGYGITDALPLTGGTLTGAITINGVSDAVVVQTNGNAAQWYGRISVRNSTSDKSSFLGTYQGVAGVFAHNNALNAWADLYVNTVDGTSGGIVRMSSDVRIGGNAALHAASTSAPNLSIGGSSARWATGRTISLTGDVSGTSAAFDGTAALSFATTLANSGVGAGTYRSVTVNAKGLVTAGTNPTTISGYGITDAMYQADPDGFTQGDINGSGNMQRLWGTDSVQNLIAFRPPTTVEYTTDNVNWVATTISNDVFDGKVFGKWSGFNMNVGSNIGAWTKVRMTWVNFGYHFFSHFTLCHSTNGHSMNFVFYKSNLSGVFSSEAYRVNGISSWPGYTFTSHVNVSGHWDTRDVRMVFELNGNNGPSGYPNNAISIGHIGIMGGYSSFNRVFDWDGNRNITLFGNLTLPGNVSATGTVSGSSFSGAGTNLTGTANSLNVGGYSARWATGRTIALTGDVTGTSGAFDGTAALSFGVTIANSAVTYAKIQNVATASVLGNSSASVAQAPAALSMATLAGMLSNQTMNINGSSASCTGNAATSTKSNSIVYPFLNTSLDLNTSGGSNELTAFNAYYPSGGAYNQPIAGSQHFRVLQFGRYDSVDSNFWRGQMAMSFYEDRMWFRRESALTWQSWREFVHSGNVGSYALPITGGTVTGNSGVLLASTNDARFDIRTGTAGAWLDIRSETLGYAAVNLYGSTVATGRWSAGMTGGNSNYRITSGAQGAGTVFMEMNSSTNATNFPNALQQNGNQVVHSGNVASYALPIGGGTVTGQVLIGSYMSLNSSASIMGMVGFNRNAATGAIFNASYGAYQLHNNTGTLELQVYNSAGGFVGAHTFNNSGNVAFLTGTVTAGGNQVVHAGNVSTYALPIGGGTLNGNLTMGSGYQHRASDGSASAPGYSFSAETNTGIARTAAGTLALVVAGATGATINSTGIGIGVVAGFKVHATGLICATDATYTGVGGTSGTFIGAGLNNDGTNPGLDLRRWTGTGSSHGASYIATDISGNTRFYNGIVATNSRATSLVATLNPSGNFSATSFSGLGTGLTGTASSLTAGSANAIADGVVSTTAKIANSVVTYAKIQNVAVSSVLGNSSASVAQAPVEIGMATLAGMLSNQTMNINGSSASCTGNAATASTSYLLGTNTGTNPSSLQYWQLSGNSTLNPNTGWWYALRLAHGDADTYYSATIAVDFFSDDIQFRRKQNNVNQTWRALLHSGNFSSYALPLTGGTLTGALTATSFSGAGTGLTGTASSLSIGGSAGSVAASGITGQTGMWTSAARPGPYRLYRRDVNDAYSVQNYWTGTYWRLDGYYSNDTVHAGCSVAYADTAGSVSTIADGAVSTTAKLANSVVTYAKIQNVGSSSVLGNTSASVSQAPQEITFSNLGAYINGVARAWVTFNENPSTGAITINASLGISSVTRINYGQYRVNFSTAFADANYAVSGTIGYESNGGYLYGGFLNIPRVATPKTTTYCEVTASYGDGNTYNARFVHVVFDR